jgi:glutamyl-tRNA synthetase
VSAPGAPRVRFAPSPTGYLHVGGGRTALWNWLFSQRTGGSFILRIEDTDTERNREEWVDGILASLEWLGVSWDEGPFRQSERTELYHAAADRLFESGHAYACDCTREMVEARTAGNPKPGYDGFCRDRGLERGPGKTLRFRVPDEGTTLVRDLIRGDVQFANETIDDFVVLKSNGAPLFVLAVVVDDMDMGITLVARGEEHLPTTPKAVMIWEALGGPELPVFAHVPVLVNEKRQKLSKRRDRVALEDYRDNGYLAAAMRNHLVLLGWSPHSHPVDQHELLTLDEMIADFRFEDVKSSPAFFDEKKLAHFNGLYIRALPHDDFVEQSSPWLTGETAPWPASGFDAGVFAELAPLAQERVSTLAEVPGYVAFVFDDDFEMEPASFDKALARDPGAAEILQLALDGLATCEWTPEELKAAVEAIAEQVGRKLAKAQAPVRVATMGSTVGLPLFESMAALGRERTLARLGAALQRLSSAADAGSAAVTGAVGEAEA